MLALFLLMVVTAGSVLGDVLYADDFNRPDSSTIGNGWVKSETGVTENAEIKDGQVKITDYDFDGGNGFHMYKPLTITYDTTVVWKVTANSNSTYYSFGLTGDNVAPHLASWQNLLADTTQLYSTEWGHWDPWIQEKSGITDGQTYTVKQYNFNLTDRSFYTDINGTITHVYVTAPFDPVTYDANLYVMTNDGFNGGSWYIDDLCAFNGNTTYEDCFPEPAPPCEPTWECIGYSDECILFRAACNQVNDTTCAPGFANYTGDYSEFTPIVCGTTTEGSGSSHQCNIDPKCNPATGLPYPTEEKKGTTFSLIPTENGAFNIFSFLDKIILTIRGWFNG